MRNQQAGALSARGHALAVLRIRGAALGVALLPAAAAVVLHTAAATGRLGGGWDALRWAVTGLAVLVLAVAAAVALAIARARPAITPTIPVEEAAAPDLYALVRDLARRLDVPVPSAVALTPDCDSWLEDRTHRAHRGRAAARRDADGRAAPVAPVLVIGSPFLWWMRVAELRALLAPVVAGTGPSAHPDIAAARRCVRGLDAAVAVADRARQPSAGGSAVGSATGALRRTGLRFVGWVARLMLRSCGPHTAEMERGVAAAAADRAKGVDRGLRTLAQEQVGLAYAGWDRLLTRVALPAWRTGRWPGRLNAGVVSALTELSRRDRLADGFASRLGERPACDLLEEPGTVDAAISLLAARLFHGEPARPDADWAPVDWAAYPEEVVDRVWRTEAARLFAALDATEPPTDDPPTEGESAGGGTTGEPVPAAGRATPAHTTPTGATTETAQGSTAAAADPAPVTGHPATGQAAGNGTAAEAKPVPLPGHPATGQAAGSETAGQAEPVPAAGRATPAHTTPTGATTETAQGSTAAAADPAAAAGHPAPADPAGSETAEAESAPAAGHVAPVRPGRTAPAPARHAWTEAAGSSTAGETEPGPVAEGAEPVSLAAYAGQPRSGATGRAPGRTAPAGTAADPAGEAEPVPAAGRPVAARLAAADPAGSERAAQAEPGMDSCSGEGEPPYGATLGRVVARLVRGGGVEAVTARISAAVAREELAYAVDGPAAGAGGGLPAPMGLPLRPPRSGRELLAEHVAAAVCCAAADTTEAVPGLDWLDGPALLLDGARPADLTGPVLALVEDGEPQPLRQWLAALGVRADKPVRLV